MIKLIKIVGVALMLCAVLPLAGGTFFYNRTKLFLETAIKTDGVVTEMVAVQSSDGGNSQSAPVYKFTAKDGTECTIRSSVSSYPPAFSVGQKIAVLYDPSNPQNAKIDGFFNIWLVPFILAVMGGGGLLIGAAFTFMGPLIIRFLVKNVTTDLDKIKQGQSI